MVAYTYTFFDLWVSEIFGSYWLAFFGNALIFAVIGIVGRMSYILLLSLLFLYAIVFTVGYGGLGIYLLLTIFSLYYLVTGIMKFAQGRD